MRYKLSTLALALVAVSANAHYHNHTIPVTVPQQDTGFHFGITGFYGRPTNHDLYYAIEGSTDFTDLPAFANRHFHAIVPGHDLGWRLDGGIQLGDSGNDFSANWTHFDSESDDTVTQFESRPLYNRFLSGQWDNVKGDAEFDFDEVNIELGQLVNYCNIHSRFFFGFSGAKVNEEIRTVSTRIYNGPIVVAQGNTETGRAKMNSEFWGFGPRLGIDINYPLGGPGSYFSLVGHASGAILGGKLETKEENTRIGKDGINNDVPLYARRVKADDQYTVIPAGTVKLGLRFALNPDPAGNGFSAELGYRLTGYYHVVQMSPDFTGEQVIEVAPQTNIVTQNESVLTNQVSNFGYNAFYLTLSYS